MLEPFLFTVSNFIELFPVSSFEKSSPLTLSRNFLKQPSLSALIYPPSFQTTCMDFTGMSLLSSTTACMLQTVKPVPTRTILCSDPFWFLHPTYFTCSSTYALSLALQHTHRVQTGARSIRHLYCSHQAGITCYLPQQVTKN